MCLYNEEFYCVSALFAKGLSSKCRLPFKNALRFFRPPGRTNNATGICLKEYMI